MSNKFVAIFALAISSLYLSSCGDEKISYESAAKLKQSHLRAVASTVNTQRACKRGGYSDKGDKLICQKEIHNNRKLPGGSSWSGKWIFVVNNEDNYVPPGITFRKTEYNPDTRQIFWGELDRKRDLPADYTQYIGLLALNENPAPSGYQIITNALNRKQEIRNFQISNNGEMSWTSSMNGMNVIDASNTSKKKVAPAFSLGTDYSCKAKYKKDTDILYGKCDFTMLVNKPGVEEKINLPAGNFFWRAIRISDADFVRLSQPGVYNDMIPQRLWFVNRKHPDIKAKLGDDWY